MKLRSDGIWGLVLGLGIMAGCQTDPLIGRRAVYGAPVTQFESIEIARESKMSLAEKGEVDLVEQLLYHRTMYAQSLRHLQDFYKKRGHAEKHKWSSNELADALSVRPYHYLLDSELPRLDLRPSKSIKAADQMYAKALKMITFAGHGTPALYNRDKMGEALRMFKQLIREYPRSDKIDDAAFYCGELHKEYFQGEDAIATQWYKLSWTWDPATPHPARFQAAVVYDYRMHDREGALELYRAAIAAEPQWRSNLVWANERVRSLTAGVPLESARTEPVAEGSLETGEQVGQKAP